MDFLSEYIGDLFYIKVTTNKATFWEADYMQNILQKEFALGYRKIIVDLSKCRTIDPPFMGAIILSYKKLLNIGGTLKVIKPENVPNQRDDVLSSLKLFELFDSKVEAIESFKTIFVAPVEEMFYPRLSTVNS